MDKEEIRQAIEDIDYEVLYTIIDCIKELQCNGTQMFQWDRDAIMEVFDKVMKGNGYDLQ